MFSAPARPPACCPWSHACNDHVSHFVGQNEPEGRKKDASVGSVYVTPAKRTGYLEICQQLLAAKATVTVQDEDEDTALHNAANGNHAAVVKLLLEAGADKTLENGDGNTPAALARDDDVVSLFD